MKRKLLNLMLILVLGYYFSMFFCENGTVMAVISAGLFIIIGVVISNLMHYGSDLCEQEDEYQIKETDEL